MIPIKQPEQYARYIHAKIINGGDFNKLASSHGNSPFANDSGDWGICILQEIRNTKLRDVAFSLKESEVSEPFKVVLLERKSDGTVESSSNSAWYIIKVDQVEAPNYFQSMKLGQK